MQRGSKAEKRKRDFFVNRIIDIKTVVLFLSKCYRSHDVIKIININVVSFINIAEAFSSKRYYDNIIAFPSSIWKFNFPRMHVKNHPREMIQPHISSK